jgi:competence protein ComEA
VRTGRLVAALAAFLASVALAAVDVNQASQADLESVRGIGPALSSVIVSERGKGEFRSWADFMARVSGVGHASAVRFSKAGLTVNGRPYDGK